MNRDDAITIIDYIEALEGRTNHQSIIAELEEAGYTPEEIDAALKALGTIAGRDCGIL
jgi:hypothetical protein